jgi:hypothetical protein
MEGRMFRFRARVASLFAVRLNRAKRFAPRGWLRKGQRLKAQTGGETSNIQFHTAGPTSNEWLKNFASLREKQKSRPDRPERL